MKLKWIRGIVGMLIGIFLFETLHTDLLEEKEVPNETSKNPHLEEFKPGSATGAVGTVTYSAGGDLNLALSGNTATGTLGTLIPDRALAITGMAATVTADKMTNLEWL